MSKKADSVDRCDLCERKRDAESPAFEPIDTKMNGLLWVCQRCANWIRTHRYAA